jgi:hypothetical protein
MKIFISSVIAGFGTQRQPAKAGVTTLRHEPALADLLVPLRRQFPSG